MNLKETIRAVEEVEDIALTDDNFTQEHLTAIEIALSALKCQRRGFGYGSTTMCSSVLSVNSKCSALLTSARAADQETKGSATRNESESVQHRESDLKGCES